jgi:hypothetical protein
MNEEQRLKFFEKYWDGRNDYDTFPHDLRADYPVSAAEKGKCLRRECGEDLSADEMRPQGKGPKPFCDPCWQDLVTADIINCIITRDRLPQGKVVAQKKHPEEINNYICDGKPRDYYTLLCNIVLGNVEIIGDSVIRFARSIPEPPAFELLEDFLSVDEGSDGPDIDDIDLIDRQIRRLYPGFATSLEDMAAQDYEYRMIRDSYLSSRREGECFLEWDFRRQHSQIKELNKLAGDVTKNIEDGNLSLNYNPDTEGLSFGDKLKNATYYSLKDRQKGW